MEIASQLNVTLQFAIATAMAVVIIVMTEEHVIGVTIILINLIAI